MSKNFVLGTSFSPEYASSIGSKNPLNILKTTINELNIKDIRLGLRWNRIEGNKGLSLEYYDKYISYLLKSKCKVTLNVGPIKVFRWPEEHIPTQFNDLNINTVKPDSDLGRYSLEYLEKLFQKIKKEYGKNMDDVVFQLDNEPFYRFGHFGITMSNEYVLNTVKILKEYFPSNLLMINTAGRRNLTRVIKVFELINNDGLFDYTSLILGFNYYFRLPNLPRRDPIKQFNPLYMGINRLKGIQEKKGFKLEISEAQFEPWGIANTPGNSYSDYVYLLDNCLELFPINYERKLIRLWGIEELVNKIHNKELSSEHKEIVKAIQYS